MSLGASWVSAPSSFAIALAYKIGYIAINHQNTQLPVLSAALNYLPKFSPFFGVKYYGNNAYKQALSRARSKNLYFRQKKNIHDYRLIFFRVIRIVYLTRVFKEKLFGQERSPFLTRGEIKARLPYVAIFRGRFDNNQGRSQATYPPVDLSPYSASANDVTEMRVKTRCLYIFASCFDLPFSPLQRIRRPWGTSEVTENVAKFVCFSHRATKQCRWIL